jgi:hypothetical protein
MFSFHQRLAGQQLRPQIGPIGLLRLDLLPQPICRLTTGLKVFIYFLAVPEIVGDRGVHVGEVQRGIAVDDTLRVSSVVEPADYNVEYDLGISHANNAVFVRAKRGGFGLDS